MMTDPDSRHADANPQRQPHRAPAVDMPATRLKSTIAQVLKDEGFILDYQVGPTGSRRRRATSTFQAEPDLSQPKLVLRVYLKYGPEGEQVIRHIERRQPAGPAALSPARQLRPVLDGWASRS